MLQVGTNYDPMIAKIVTHAADRESALQLLRQALAETQVCDTLQPTPAFPAAHLVILLPAGPVCACPAAS
jgi:acetyl/propionyl-CoA carboxylase alpha subunit